jgi:hypothetical protein
VRPGWHCVESRDRGLVPETTRCRRSATDCGTRSPISRPSPSLMTARPAKSILNTVTCEAGVCAFEDAFQGGHEELLIRQAGERVMQRLVAQLLPEQMQFGDVLHNCHLVRRRPSASRSRDTAR